MSRDPTTRFRIVIVESQKGKAAGRSGVEIHTIRFAYPLIPHPHKLLDRIESGSGNSESISAIGEQRSSLVELNPGEILSKLLRRRYVLVTGMDVITLIPWNQKQFKLEHIQHMFHKCDEPSGLLFTELAERSLISELCKLERHARGKDRDET